MHIDIALRPRNSCEKKSAAVIFGRWMILSKLASRLCGKKTASQPLRSTRTRIIYPIFSSIPHSPVLLSISVGLRIFRVILTSNEGFPNRYERVVGVQPARRS